MVLPNGGYEMPYKFETPMPSMPPSIEIPQFRTFSQNRTIGIFGEPLGQEEQLAEFFGVRSGILIRSVVKGSAAEKAGIKAGDVLTKIDDKTVASPSEITAALRAAGSRRTFTVTVVRNKKEMALTLTLENVTSIRGGLWHIDGWDVLPFSAYQRIIQGAEEGVPEIIR
jgi:membrane-associated protease RseP (regulator of RpoE activity)